MIFKIIYFNDIFILYLVMQFQHNAFKSNFEIIYSNQIKNQQIHKSALFLAIEKENIEIVKLLLINDKIDVNFLNVFNLFYLFHLIIYFNDIQKILLIEFEIKFMDLIQNK